jgi:hypothetical protein
MTAAGHKLRASASKRATRASRRSQERDWPNGYEGQCPGDDRVCRGRHRLVLVGRDGHGHRWPLRSWSSRQRTACPSTLTSHSMASSLNRLGLALRARPPVVGAARHRAGVVLDHVALLTLRAPWISCRCSSMHLRDFPGTCGPRLLVVYTVGATEGAVLAPDLLARPLCLGSAFPPRGR